jgi:hypothetical protein
MARPDGRIEKGQRLSSAISAKAWNRAQEAADRVLGAGTGVEAGPLATFSLPSVRVTLRDQGWFGQCRFAINDSYFGLSPGAGLFPQTPASNESLSSFSENEKRIPQYTLPYTALSGPYIELPPQQRNVTSGLFVCVGNQSNSYAMSGLAFTRIRVFNYLHRFARNPIEFPGQSQQQGTAANGCLDSSFWGLARIVGYWNGVDDAGNLIVRHSSAAGLSYPNFEYRWALIHF